MVAKNLLSTLTSAALLICAAGCQLYPCLNGEGPSVHRELVLEPFHAIRLDGSMAVYYAQGTDNAELEGQENILDLIVVEVKDGVCHIHSDQCYSSRVPVQLHLASAALDEVTVNGSGTITGQGSLDLEDLTEQVQGSGTVSLECNANTIRATVNGSGFVNLKGRCAQLEATVNGSGDIDAGDLESENVVAAVTGSGDVLVHATDSVDARVTGSGNIAYRGGPVVSRSLTGSGSIAPEQ